MHFSDDDVQCAIPHMKPTESESVIKWQSGLGFSLGTRLMHVGNSYSLICCRRHLLHCTSMRHSTLPRDYCTVSTALLSRPS
jgi:hypothetical protein